MNLSTPHNQHQFLLVNHVGSFLILIFLSTFRPTSIWPDFPFSLEPIAVLTLGLLLLYKIHLTIGYRAFLIRYKIELLLLLAYFCVCFISLFLNSWRYQNTQEFIRYGVTFIVITACFPATIFLFSLPKSQRGLSFSQSKYSSYVLWLYFALLALMIIWQFYDYESSKSVASYFVASEVWPDRNISGFFRVSTDVAPVLFILIVVLTYSLKVYTQSKYLFVMLACLIGLFFFAGMLTGSRVFFLSMATACVIWILRSKAPLGHKATWLIFAFIASNLALMFSNSTVITKLQPFIQYLGPLYYGLPFTINDFGIDINLTPTRRQDVWIGALSLIAENPYLGISSGGFRLNNAELQNTHNLILQILVDSGAVGFVILLCLAYRLRAKFKQPIVWIFLIALLVDFPLGHSMPYIVSCGFIISIILAGNREYESNSNYVIESSYKLRYYLAVSWASICALSIILVSIFYFRNLALLAQDEKLRISSQIKARVFDKRPILIDDIKYTSHYFEQVKGFPYYLVNTLDSSMTLCHYQYLKSRYISNNQDSWLKPAATKCEPFNVDPMALSNTDTWLTNKIYRKKTEHWYFPDGVQFFSPTVNVGKGLFDFRLIARGTDSLGEFIELKVTFMSDGKAVATQNIAITEKKYKEYRVRFDTNKKALGYFVVSLVNPAIVSVTKNYRRAWIKTNSIRVAPLNEL